MPPKGIIKTGEVPRNPGLEVDGIPDAYVPPEWFIYPKALREATPLPTAPVPATGRALAWAEAMSVAREPRPAARPRGDAVGEQMPVRPYGPVSRH